MAQAVEDVVELLLEKHVQVGVGFIQQDQAGGSGKHERENEEHLMKPAARRGDIQGRETSKAIARWYAFQILAGNVGRTRIRRLEQTVAKDVRHDFHKPLPIVAVPSFGHFEQ